MSAVAVERALLRRTDAFGAVSASENHQLQALAKGRVPVVVVPHWVEAAAPTLPLAARRAQIVAVGRLSFQKNPEFVADLPRLMAERGHAPIRFTWVGDGDPARRRLLLASGWEVTGWVAPSQVRAIVGAATALVHPARYEALPLAVVEALACGTPALVRDIPAFQSLSSVVRFRTAADLVGNLHTVFSDLLEWSRVSSRGWSEAADSFSRARQHAALERLYNLVR